MTLHRALLSMEFLYFCFPLPSWRHRNSFVVEAFATKICQHILPLAGNRTLWYGVVSILFLGEFGVVPLWRTDS